MKLELLADTAIVPTHVGVNRKDKKDNGAKTNCPHARGGEPATSGPLEIICLLSPRTWG